VIDLAIIRDDPDRIKAEVKQRGLKVDVDKLVKLDTDRRSNQAKFDALRARQKGIRDAKAGAKLKADLKKLEGKQKKVIEEFEGFCLLLPNFSAEDVPKGADESGNKPEKTVGKKPTLKKAKAHYEIPGIKPLIDFERGAKVSGNRFWFLKGPLVDMEFGLIRYTLDFYAKQGFEAMRPPSIVNESAMLGTGFFPADADMIYAVSHPDEQDKKYLSGTAEVPLASYHAGESLEGVPLKYVGFSPSYRREAGSYGKDTKGIFRGHEFDKLELFVFSAPDKSWEAHEALQEDAEEFWTSLGIPFQVVNICTGDLAAPNAKKLDINAWLPGEGKYREIASNSNDTDFQARRLKIKSNGELVHTLNNTACAIGRTIIAIVENYQDQDGNVDMPEVLHQYLPFKRINKDATTS
jgi:seryl-tRNA synthetase